MLSYLKGTLQFASENYIILDVNDIGFKIYIPRSSLNKLPAVGERLKVLTYLHIKEEELTLYGFLTPSELKIFELMLTVSGIGPKGAIAALSTLSPQKLQECFLTEDVKTLTSIPGFGQKTAKRIIFELKDKIARTDASALLEDKAGRNFQEAIKVLEALGYSPAESAAIIKKLNIDLEKTSVEAIVKEVLKKIGSQNK
ncbi:MAG: Holliday junction branch migration protein RuvA [Firmicutes bacterium]|jgi:Holliday junction DNA helicase RuvA|nr:Holliday junction branch migration protein RuvA [Bacillota bacterium]